MLRHSWKFSYQDKDENDDSETVGEAVSGDGVPVDGHLVSGEQATNGDNPEDVKDCAAHDGANSKITFGDKSSHDVGEEFWRACA